MIKLIIAFLLFLSASVQAAARKDSTDIVRYRVMFSQDSSWVDKGDVGLANFASSLRLLPDNTPIHITGYASPDGRIEYNRRLAAQRAYSVADYLKTCGINANMISVDPQGVVNFSELYSRLQKDNSSLAQQARSQLNTLLDNKSRKTRANNQAWAYLVYNYFPALRYSEITYPVIQPDVEEPKEEPIIEESEPDTVPVFYSVEKKDTVEVVNRECRRPLLSIRTNLLYDFAAYIPDYGWAPTPNIGLEYYPRNGHFSISAEVMFAPWRDDSKAKTWILHSALLEGRYYLKRSRWDGHFFSIYGQGGEYDLQLSSTKAYQSKGWGYSWVAGIGYGYAWRLGECSPWKIEANIGLGVMTTKYDRYHTAESWATPNEYYYNWHMEPDNFERRPYSKTWWGVTRLGLSISYDIFKY